MGPLVNHGFFLLPEIFARDFFLGGGGGGGKKSRAKFLPEIFGNAEIFSEKNLEHKKISGNKKTHVVNRSDDYCFS